LTENLTQKLESSRSRPLDPVSSEDTRDLTGAERGKISPMRTSQRLAALALLLVVGACAPKSVPVPVVSAPKFPDFIEPTVPSALAGTAAADRQARGWRFLQAGDFKNAERELSAALKIGPDFYPAETALGYVEFARHDAKAALGHFDRALAQEGADLSALVGRGEALLALGREADALVALDAALAVDPRLMAVVQRVEVLRFRGQQNDLNQARQAARDGRLDEAIAVYTRAIAASPDSAILYRELGTIEGQQGNTERALEHLRRAVALEPSDARSLVQIGDLLEGQRDFEGAAKVWAEALAVEPNPAVEIKLANMRARAELARLPDEYRAIVGSAQITRADLAALVGVRLAPLLRETGRRDAVVITDIRNNWAANWIMAAAQARVMEPFANHEFQPRTAVRRIDLAQVVDRLLAKIGEASPGHPANTWRSARGSFADLAASHVAYRAASAAVASSVMTTDASGNFFPTRPVSGPEADDVIGRIEMMARPLLARDASSR
jgi:tetratricopeptide (TPR) repeat protein